MFLFFCLFCKCICVGGKVNRNTKIKSSCLAPFSFKSAFITLLVPPISLVAYSATPATPATTAYSTVVAFQFWCDGWRGDCWLPAHPLVMWGLPSVDTEPGVWWHLAFYRKNYASVLTFSLMHKIHDVCGTSCRRCSTERGKEYVTAEARTHTTSPRPDTHTHTHTIIEHIYIQ